MKQVEHEQYLLEKTATIEDALAAITENKRGAILIVDGDKTIVGVVSDGDIRRALLKGATVMTPIGKIANPNTLSVGKEGTQKNIDSMFESRPEINLIPVVDNKNRVLDVRVRRSSKYDESHS